MFYLPVTICALICLCLFPFSNRISQNLFFFLALRTISDSYTSRNNILCTAWWNGMCAVCTRNQMATQIRNKKKESAHEYTTVHKTRILSNTAVLLGVVYRCVTAMKKRWSDATRYTATSCVKYRVTWDVLWFFCRCLWGHGTDANGRWRQICVTVTVYPVVAASCSGFCADWK